MTGGGGSHSDDPPGLENSSDGGSDGDRRDGESSDGDSSEEEDEEDKENGEDKGKGVACTTCRSPWPGDRWRASEPSFTPSENCVTFCLSECTSKRWCEPETRRGSFY